MSRPLLPKHNERIAKATPGQWLDFTQEFSIFQSNIEVPLKAENNVTSIPSPWARMLLFKEAIKDRDHMLHMEIMSSILDVLELIFYEGMLSLSLNVKEIHISNEQTNNKLRKVLYDLYPSDIEDISITLLIASRGNETFVIAGTSPYTMFFTSLDLKIQNKFTRYFKSVPVPLSERPSDFQIYINKIFIPNLSQDGRFKELVDAFKFSNGICENSDQELADNSKYELSDLSQQFGLKSILFKYKSKEIISDNQLLSSKINPKSPLVLDESSCRKGKPYYNDYLFNDDHKLSDLRNMNRKTLPGEDIAYPWVLPIQDFLQPVIIKYKYKLNNKFLIVGKSTDAFEYALPLTKKFFEYFKPEDVDKLLTIKDMGSNKVRIKLDIPIQNGKFIEIIKDYLGTYSQDGDENVILEYDSRDSSTPLPHIIIWPNLSPEEWKDPYYGYVYGRRYGDSVTEKQISLEFLDDKLESINHAQSRKTNAVEIFKFEKLPTYVFLNEVKSKSQALLLLDHKIFSTHQVTVDNAVVGIDFGTSHTNIATKYNNITNILKYSSNFRGENLNDHDFITLVQFSEHQASEDSLPVLVKSNMNQYFMPNCLSEINDEQSVNLPLPTMVAIEKNVQVKALLGASISFSKKFMYPYFIDTKPIDKEIQVMTDLKWNHELTTQNATKEYLRILLFLVKYELIKNGINLNTVKYFWAYPKSFSEVGFHRYKNMWKDLLPTQIVKSTDESKAALLYFDYRDYVKRHGANMSIVVDVGGGSSDVSVWSDGSIHLLYSSLWAGRNLVGVLARDKADIVHSVIFEAINVVFHGISSRFKGRNNFQAYLNFMLFSIPDKELTQRMQTKEFFRVKFLIIYFFSSLFFEIGLQSKKFLSKNDTINICLAGNGSRFACWSSSDPGKISDLEAEIYRKVIRHAMVIDDNVEIKFIPSIEQKNEVAIGLCEGGNELLNQSAENEPYLAESLSFKKHDVKSGMLIKEFDEMIGENGNTINIDKKDSEILRFHDVLFEILAESNLYRQELKHDPMLENLDKIKQTIIGDWNNLVGSIRGKVISNKLELNSISSSIFILGMQYTITRLHSYLFQADKQD